MDHLDEISVEALQQLLASVENKTPTKRLTAAIAYKNGITQTELAEWYGVERKTIYSWLQRFDRAEIEEALTNTSPPGRPRKLSSAQQERFERALQQSPQEYGYEAPTWTPALVRQYLTETFGVEYSLVSCRRLLSEAGLCYRTPRETEPTIETAEIDDPTAKHWLP